MSGVVGNFECFCMANNDLHDTDRRGMVDQQQKRANWLSWRFNTISDNVYAHSWWKFERNNQNIHRNRRISNFGAIENLIIVRKCRKTWARLCVHVCEWLCVCVCVFMRADKSVNVRVVHMWRWKTERVTKINQVY